jgi:transposase-like protein
VARREYSDETKAAVMAALLTGQSIGSIAEEYSIPKSTVKSWKSRQLNGESVATVATEKKAIIGDLLIEYLEANLKALKSQTVVFADETWLKKQTAENLAVLHGVMTDKAVRLLEALSKNAADDNAAES